MRQRRMVASFGRGMAAIALLCATGLGSGPALAEQPKASDLARLVDASADSYISLSRPVAGLLCGHDGNLPPLVARIAAQMEPDFENDLLGTKEGQPPVLSTADFSTWFDGQAALALRDFQLDAHVAPHAGGKARGHATHRGKGKRAAAKTTKPAKSQSTSQELYLFSSRDDAAAATELANLAGRAHLRKVATTPFPLYASGDPKQPHFLATGKGIVLVSNSRPWIEQTLMRAAHKAQVPHPLADDAKFKAVMGRLPGDGLAYAYVGGLADAPKKAVPRKIRKEADAAETLDALDSAGAALQVNADGVAVDTLLHFDKKKGHLPEAGPSLDANSLDAVSDGAIGFLSFALPAQFMKDILSSPDMPQVPGLTADAFKWLQGTLNLVVVPQVHADTDALPLSAYLTVRTPDMAGAQAGMHRLADLAELVLSSMDASGSASFQTASRGGMDWSLWREDATTPEMGGYAFGPKDVYVAVGQDGVSAAASHSAITANPDFQAAFRHLPSPSSALAYLDVPQVADLVRAQLKGKDLADFDKNAGPMLKYVHSFAFGLSSPWIGPDGFAHGVAMLRLRDGWDK